MERSNSEQAKHDQQEAVKRNFAKVFQKPLRPEDKDDGPSHIRYNNDEDRLLLARSQRDDMA